MDDQHWNTRLDAENHQHNQVPSSIASRLRTNYVPTNDELTMLRSWLIAPTARLDELKAMMKQKEVDHSALLEQRAQLERDIAKYRALASPMRRLPVDVLRELFLHCVPTEHNSIPSREREPMSLTRVCSAWRAVALATPALWASLHIAVPVHYKNARLYESDVNPAWYETEAEKATEMRTRMLREWLARSGACRLDISLHDKRADYDWPHTNYEKFLEIIIPHSKRWRSMTFTTAAHSLLPIVALSAEDVPALEEIVININSPTFSNTLHNDPDFPVLSWGSMSVLGAPRLQRVSFSNLGENINTLPIHFEQLTHISLKAAHNRDGNTSLANISALLAKCLNLTSARLEIADEEDQPPVDAPFQPVCTRPIVLPHLIHLSLLNRDVSIPSFFAMLNAPQLRVLEYHTRVPGQRAHDFIGFLSRVSETLTDLTTNAGMFSRSDFFEMLKAARRLRRLVQRGHSSMESSRPWEHIRDDIEHFDDVFLGMLVGRRLGQDMGMSEQSNWTVEADAELDKGGVRGVEMTIDNHSQILLPELEILDCPANFTDDRLLEFLRLRQNLSGNETNSSTSVISATEERQNNVPILRTSPSPLRRLHLLFDRKATRKTVYEDIVPFQDAGLVLHLLYSDVPARDPFPPTDGIPSVTSLAFIP